MRQAQGKGIGHWAIAIGLAMTLTGCSTFLKKAEQVPWFATTMQAVPTQSDLLDLKFTSATTGWVVGSRATILKTEDGGKTWHPAFKTALQAPNPETSKLEDLKARFLSVDFTADGQEGWVVGKPRIVLHTTDGGKSLFAVPLNKRIDGAPLLITALAPGVAELAMDTGTVFKTSDGGKTWRVLTPESAGGLRNITRRADGSYWAVSARGSTYLNWEPGTIKWINHERVSPKRIENLVFLDQTQAALLNNGGELQLSADSGKTWSRPKTPDLAAATGLFDAGFDPTGRLWVAGGNATLLVSPDQGKNWERAFLETKSNLYRIEFPQKNLGFLLGKGVILRYQVS